MSTQSLAMIIALFGTTIAPWMQFYMKASVVGKCLEMKNFKYTIVDIVVGCAATVVVAFFIMVACGSTLFPNGIAIAETKDAAMALEPWREDFHRRCLLLDYS